MTSDEYDDIRADALDGNEDPRVIRLLRTNARPDRPDHADAYMRGYVQGRSDLAHQLLNEMGIR